MEPCIPRRMGHSIWSFAGESFFRGDLARFCRREIVRSHNVEMMTDYSLIQSQTRLDYSTPSSDFQIGPITTHTLKYCIGLCMNQGTQCMGPSWVPSRRLCHMKLFMQRGGDRDYTVHSAVRMSPAGGMSIQVLENPGFDTGGLSPWMTYCGGNPECFAVSDAGVSHAFSYFQATFSLLLTIPKLRLSRNRRSCSRVRSTALS